MRELFINLNIIYSFRMNTKFLTLAVLLCISIIPALGTWEIVLGGATLSAAGTSLLAAGLLGAKAVGIAIGSRLASKGVWLIYILSM